MQDYVKILNKVKAFLVIVEGQLYITLTILNLYHKTKKTI